ncbi:Alpha-1-antitrypsin, partial [Ophiophagus hannah]
GTARVSIPKFSISATYSLKGPFSQLGITEIFTDHADLTGVTGQPLKLSKVTHKAVLTVDETGAEAAGATAGEAIPMSLPPSYTFNHPFLFFIFDTKYPYSSPANFGIIIWKDIQNLTKKLDNSHLFR